MEKTYKCITTFEVDEFGPDASRTGEFKTVDKGSVWYVTDDNIIGDEIHLELEGGSCELSWIEIDHKDLEQNFELIDSGRVRITIGCMNTKCQHYWEDMCLRKFRDHEIIWFDKDGMCDQFIEGKNELYLSEESENKLES